MSYRQKSAAINIPAHLLPQAMLDAREESSGFEILPQNQSNAFSTHHQNHQNHQPMVAQSQPKSQTLVNLGSDNLSDSRQGQDTSSYNPITSSSRSDKPPYPHYREDAEAQRQSLRRREEQYQSAQALTAAATTTSAAIQHQNHGGSISRDEFRGHHSGETSVHSGQRTYQELSPDLRGATVAAPLATLAPYPSGSDHTSLLLLLQSSNDRDHPSNQRRRPPQEWDQGQSLQNSQNFGKLHQNQPHYAVNQPHPSQTLHNHPSNQQIYSQNGPNYQQLYPQNPVYSSQQSYNQSMLNNPGQNPGQMTSNGPNPAQKHPQYPYLLNPASFAANAAPNPPNLANFGPGTPLYAAQPSNMSPQAPSLSRYGQVPRQTRRVPLQQTLPSIQTNQVLENSNNGRRIVLTPQYSQQSPRERVDPRAKSLLRASTQPMAMPLALLSQTTLNNSSRTFSLSSKSRSFSSLGKLLSLSTKKFGSSSSLQGPNASAGSLVKTDRNVLLLTINMKSLAVKGPQVYPALLSRVSKVFKELILLNINTKDGLEYHDTFTGKIAVDIISRIVRTNDRNLALLLGRSLDAQKFFHDVTYNHRLRDSVHEVYAFSRAFSDVEFYDYNGNGTGTITGLVPNSKHGSFNGDSVTPGTPVMSEVPSMTSLNNLNNLNNLGNGGTGVDTEATGVNGVFTILTDCYSPTCTRNKLCYSISCPRRLEQQARLNLKPLGGLRRTVSRLLLHDTEESKTLWHETVPALILEKLDKHEKMRQELIYEFIYTERDYVKDLEFLTDFYIMPLRNPANNIIPEREREAFIRTVFGGVSDLLWLGKQLSEMLTRRQQQQKPVIETIADVFLKYVGQFEPFIKYLGNKVFALFEHERQQQVNLKYARFLDAIEKKPELRRQDLLSFLIKGVQRPARYQLLLGGILKNTPKEHPDYKNLVKAKEEIEKVLVKINIQTGELTDRHKIMVIHRLLGKQTLEEKFHFRLNYLHRIIYQTTLSRKRERDNEKIDLYLFEHALLLVKHKFQNKREQHKVFERPIYLPLLYVNSGYEFPALRQIISGRIDGSIVSDTQVRQGKIETNYVGASLGVARLQLNFLGLGRNQVHLLLFADDVTNQTQVLLQIHQQQKKLIEKNDIFLLLKYETRRFHGNNKINCAVPCYGGKKLLYGTDLGVWVLTVRLILATLNEKICLDPTLVILKLYVTQIEVLVEYLKLLILLDKTLYEYDLACTDLLDHVKNTRLGREILTHVLFFKLGICEKRLLVVAAKKGSSGGTHLISIFEPLNPFDSKGNKTHKSKKYDISEFGFSSDPVLISFFKRKLCVGCVKGFEILLLEDGRKEPILDEADPLLDFATQRELVTPLAIHRLGYNFLVLYLEFLFLINKNGWRTSHDWGIFWEGSPQNIAIFYPYLLAFEPGFIEVRELDLTNILRALVGENIRFLHLNEHEALYACEENGYDIIVSIDFLNLKPKKEGK